MLEGYLKTLARKILAEEISGWYKESADLIIRLHEANALVKKLRRKNEILNGRAEKADGLYEQQRRDYEVLRRMLDEAIDRERNTTERLLNRAGLTDPTVKVDRPAAHAPVGRNARVPWNQVAARAEANSKEQRWTKVIEEVEKHDEKNNPADAVHTDRPDSAVMGTGAEPIDQGASDSPEPSRDS